MTPVNRHWLRTAGRVACMATMMTCAVGLAVGVMDLSLRGPMPAHAAVSPKAAEIVNPTSGAALTSGGSATDFRVKLPSGSACTGDSANAGYRIQSFLVPQSVALSSLQFDADGPVAASGEFRAPLYDTTSTPYTNQLTAVANPAPGPGPIIQPIPSFNFSVYDTASLPLPAGSYNVGIACTLGPPSATQLDAVWSVGMTIVADAADAGPAKIRFTVAPTATPTTTTSVAPTTSTTLGTGSSSTTSTTTASGGTGSTTTSTAPGSAAGTSAATDTALASADASGIPATLAATGSPVLRLLAWAFMLVCSGYGLVLLSRPTRVIEVP